MNDAIDQGKAMTFDDVLSEALAKARNDKDVERRLHLWGADCAAHVLHIYERSETSDAPRKAIMATRRFARGEIDDAEMAYARGAAWDVAWDASWDAAWDAAWAAVGYAELASVVETVVDAAWAAAWAAVGDAAWDVAWVTIEAEWNKSKAAARVTRLAAVDDVGDASWGAAWDAEEAWQFDRLIQWLSDNEPADWPLPDMAKLEDEE